MSGARVSLRVPRDAVGKRLVKMAVTNAWLHLRREEDDAGHDAAGEPADRRGLEALGRVLDLGAAPERIEGYDVSNLAGGDAVASRAVFLHGRPAPKLYRRYRIRGVRGANDFAMLQEILDRRLRRRDEDAPPDLLVVDGGAGQVSAVRRVLEAQGLAALPLIGLAKKHEEIYLPGRERPLRLAAGHPALALLIRLRDEAHRFAVAYHRRLRSKRMHASVLDRVEGLGPVKRRDLLRTFGSVEALLRVSPDDLAARPGIGPVLAERIQAAIRGAKR